MLYCGLATLVTLLNKYILLTFVPNDCRANLFILFLQSLTCLVLMRICKKFSLLNYKPFNFNYLKSWAPIVVSLILSIYSNGRSLQLLPVSTFNVLKNLGLVLTVAGDIMFFGRKVCLDTFFAVFMILFTSISYEMGFNIEKPESTNAGVFWAIINCMACSVYGLYVKYHRIQHQNIDSTEYVYYNTLLTTPALAMLSLYFEGTRCTHSIITADNFIVFLLLSSALTLFIAIVISNIYKSTTPTAYSIVGSLNKLPMTCLSGLIFRDEILGSNIIYVLLSILTGIYFVLYA